MTRRLGRAGGVTAWLRARRAARARDHVVSRDAWAPAVDVAVPEGVVVVLSPPTELDLAWYGPSKAERNSVTVVTSQPADVTPPDLAHWRDAGSEPGTPRATHGAKKGKRKRRP